MLSNPRLLIHIGYPKTASGWLQKGIFQDTTAGFLAPWGGLSGEASVQFIIPNAFRFSAESVRKVFEPGLQEAARQNLVPVLSNEHLACNQIRGRYHGKEVADRLYATFPEARILVFIREQKSMIFSSYQQFIKGGKGETATIQQFIGAEITKPAFEPTCRLDYLEYDLLIAYYQNIFGSENILVLPFELIKIKAEDVLKKIMDFAEARETNKKLNTYPSKNVGLKAGTLAVKRRLNHIIKEPNFGGSQRTLNWRIVDKLSKTIDSIPFLDGVHQGIENDWKQFIAEYVGDYFRLSNQRTSQLIGMNIADFGYDC